jgi:hypothetical protein
MTCEPTHLDLAHSHDDEKVRLDGVERDRFRGLGWKTAFDELANETADKRLVLDASCRLRERTGTLGRAGTRAGSDDHREH